MRCLSSGYLEIQKLDKSRGLLAQTPCCDTSVLDLLLNRLRQACEIFLSLDEAIVDLAFQRVCDEIAEYVPLVNPINPHSRFSSEVRQYWNVDTTEDYQLMSEILRDLFWWEGDKNGLYEFNFPQSQKSEVVSTNSFEDRVTLPPPSSGVFEVDTFASLSTINGMGIRDVLALCDRASAEWIKLFIIQSTEMRQSPEERLDEYKRKCLQKTMDTWQAEDPGKYAELMGISFENSN